MALEPRHLSLEVPDANEELRETHRRGRVRDHVVHEDGHTDALTSVSRACRDGLGPVRDLHLTSSCRLVC